MNVYVLVRDEGVRESCGMVKFPFQSGFRMENGVGRGQKNRLVRNNSQGKR